MTHPKRKTKNYVGKGTIVYAKGAKVTQGESNKKVPGAKITSKSTLKMKSKNGKGSEKFKSKIYSTSLDDNTVSRIKGKYSSKRGGKATETFKQIKKNKDGTYTLSKCNKRGKCTTRKVMKVRGKFNKRRMKKNRDKLSKEK